MIAGNKGFDRTEIRANSLTSLSKLYDQILIFGVAIGQAVMYRSLLVSDRDKKHTCCCSLRGGQIRGLAGFRLLLGSRL